MSRVFQFNFGEIGESEFHHRHLAITHKLRPIGSAGRETHPSRQRQGTQSQSVRHSQNRAQMVGEQNRTVLRPPVHGGRLAGTCIPASVRGMMVKSLSAPSACSLMHPFALRTSFLCGLLATSTAFATLPRSKPNPSCCSIVQPSEVASGFEFDRIRWNKSLDSRGLKL